LNQPLILITNDDGISARGLSVLAEEMKKIGRVEIVAPDSERSATGHAITLTDPLRVEKIYHDGELFGHAVSGTPADAVKVAVKAILDRAPDLVVSGINLGPNTGVNVIYSGTVSAATEAAIMGLKAIAVSLGTFVKPDFAVAARYAVWLAKKALQNPFPPGVVLNLNVPALPEAKIRGVKLTRQGLAGYDEVLEKRQDLRGKTYYWLGGELMISRDGDDCDSRALQDGFVSITPLQFDMTSYPALAELGRWGLEEERPGKEEKEPGRRS
jgi:5'-nucleotidase